MSILNISIKLIAVKIVSVLSVKKITTQFHCLKMICITLLINVCSFESHATPLFDVESHEKPLFDVSFKSHNVRINNDLGVIVMEKDAERVVYYNPKSEASVLEGVASNIEKRAIVYSNGMFTSPIKAANNLNTVRRSFQYTANTSKFYLAYNQSEEELNQVAEVAAQHLKQKGNLTDRQAWFQMAYKLLLPKVYNILEDAETAIASIDEANYVNDIDLNSHINQYYLPLLEAGNKVVILSHSQGNFYANRAWNTIANMTNGSELTKALGIVGVADVASYVAGNGLHTTNGNDFIVNAVRALGNTQPLPANITHPIFATKEPWGHGLSEIYLNDDLESKHIKAKIQADVNTTFDRLEVLRQEPGTCTSASWNVDYENPVGLNAFHHPGENYKGMIHAHLRAENGQTNRKSSIIITASENGQRLVDTNWKDGAIEEYFEYNSSIHGTLNVRVLINNVKSGWRVELRCF